MQSQISCRQPKVEILNSCSWNIKKESLQWRYYHNRLSTVLARIDFLGILNFQQIKTNFRQSYRFLESEKPNYREIEIIPKKENTQNKNRIPKKISEVLGSDETMHN